MTLKKRGVKSLMKWIEVMIHLTDINLMIDDLIKNFARMAKVQHDRLDPAFVLMEWFQAWDVPKYKRLILFTSFLSDSF